MKKKTISKLIVGILAVSLVALTACSSNSNSSIKSTEKAVDKSNDKNFVIKFGYQPGQSQIVVARDKGWLKDEFDKDGITFEFSKFTSGPPLIEAMTAGKVDFGQVGDQPAVLARANNVDVKAIAAYGTSEKNDALLATTKSGINKIADLKGKKVGVTIGSVGQQLLYIYLKSVGLKITDIEQINLQPADIKSSLLSNQIDAAVTWEPNVTQLITTGTVKQIADGTGYKKEVDVIITTNSFLKAHPDVTARLLKVLEKTSKWEDGNKDETLDIVSKDTGINKNILEPGFNKVSRELNLSKDDIASVDATTKFLKDNGVIRKEVNVNDLIDTSYLKKAGIIK